MVDWAYLIGGKHDLTKLPKPEHNDEYIRMISQDESLPYWRNLQEIPTLVTVDTELYKLTTKVGVNSKDTAYFYIYVSRQ